MAEKELYGLLGRNISYSLSPVMHNAAFRHKGMDAEYRIFDIEEDSIEDFMRDEILSGNLKGFNITVPYKIVMMEKLLGCALLNVEGDKPDDWVKIIGAINTVKVEGNSVRLANTDAEGFVSSLDTAIDFDAKRGKRFFIAGAGGAGRAIALYLARMVKPKKITVYDIDGAKLDSLRKDFDKWFDPNILSTLSDEAEVSGDLRNCDLLVNATPLGTREGDPMPVREDLIGDNIAVYDLVYCRKTELVKAAEQKGLKASSGLGMLVGQAARSFEIWTGFKADEVRAVMESAALEELEKRAKKD